MQKVKILCIRDIKGGKGKAPCERCWCPGPEFHDPDCHHPPRNSWEDAMLYDEAMAMYEAGAQIPNATMLWDVLGEYGLTEVFICPH